MARMAATVPRKCVGRRTLYTNDGVRLLSEGRLAPEPSLKQPQRRTHGLPNIHHIVVYTCTRRLLDSQLPTLPVPVLLFQFPRFSRGKDMNILCKYHKRTGARSANSLLL